MGRLSHTGTEPLDKIAACVGSNVGGCPASQTRGLPPWCPCLMIPVTPHEPGMQEQLGVGGLTVPESWEHPKGKTQSKKGGA